MVARVAGDPAAGLRVTGAPSGKLSPSNRPHFGPDRLKASTPCQYTHPFGRRYWKSWAICVESVTAEPMSVAIPPVPYSDIHRSLPPELARLASCGRVGPLDRLLT